MEFGMADCSHCCLRCAPPSMSADCHPICPGPGGEIIRQGSVCGMRAQVPLNPQVNIIYRDCVTSFGAPSPNLFSRCTQSRLCSNLLCIDKFSYCASNPPCRVGRQHWARCAGLRPPGRLLTQDFLLQGANAGTLINVGVYAAEYLRSRQKVRPAGLPSSVQLPLQGRIPGLLLLIKHSPLTLRPAAPCFLKKRIPCMLRGSVY